MNFISKTIVVSLFFILFIHKISFSQNLPISFTNNELSADVSTTTLHGFDAVATAREDESNGFSNRFSQGIDCDLNPENSGTMETLSNGDRVWRLKIKSANAIGLIFYFDEFELAQGAKIFMYNSDRTKVYGPFTTKDKTKSNKFLSPIMKGEEITIEFYEPNWAVGRSKINMYKTYHIYKEEALAPPAPIEDVAQYGNGHERSESGFGTSLLCNININCTLGDNWQNQKKGVVRILMVFENATGWCTGSFINNTNQDGTPYILSAHHCQNFTGFVPVFDMWQFHFNYESANCTDPFEEPSYGISTGAIVVSKRFDSDFLLMRLTDDLPPNTNVYLNGWNKNDTTVPQTSTIIHHPNGDMKKISVDTEPAEILTTSINWNNGNTTPPNHHFKIILNQGTYETGSSGCPSFDENGLIVGQLNGGISDCFQFLGYIGRFSRSWAEGATAEERLKEWLDPINSNVVTLPGMYMPVTATNSISGNIHTTTGRPISNQQLKIESGDYVYYTTTDTSGNYTFTGLEANADYTISIENNNEHANGVTTLDLVLIKKHILGITEFTQPWQWLAADANNNHSVSTLDLVDLRRLILGITTTYPNNVSWKFVPETYQWGDIANGQFIVQNLQGDVDSVNFIAVKIGDLNDTVILH